MILLNSEDKKAVFFGCLYTRRTCRRGYWPWYLGSA